MTDYPLQLAEKLGASIGGELGKEAFRELELAYINSILPRFLNNPLIRMKQHILLYWSQSYHKSTIIDQFCKCLPDAINQINITSNSPEKLYGSINDKSQIIYPLFTNAQIGKITELSTFVNSRNSEEIINTMNKIMEGEPVERQLLKFGRREISREELELAKQQGVFYDPIIGQLSYNANITIFAASRPLQNHIYTQLKSSGNLFRHHIIQHEISDSEAEDYLKRTYAPNIPLYEQLKTFNTKAMEVKIGKVETPNDQITVELIDSLIGIVKDAIRESEASFASIVDIRTKGDVLRELAAHTAVRSMVENDFKDLTHLEYTREDVNFIIGNIEHFVEAKVNPLFTYELSKPNYRKARPIETVKQNIIEFLDKEIEKSRRDIDAYVMANSNICKATISNALSKLLKEEKIVSERFGYYKNNF